MMILLELGIIYLLFLSSRFIDQYHAELKSLLRLDPFTLTAFVYVCPDPALCELFSLVPPNVSTAWLSYMLNNFPYDVRDSTQVSLSSYM